MFKPSSPSAKQNVSADEIVISNIPVSCNSWVLEHSTVHKCKVLGIAWSGWGGSLSRPSQGRRVSEVAVTRIRRSTAFHSGGYFIVGLPCKTSWRSRSWSSSDFKPAVGIYVLSRRDAWGTGRARQRIGRAGGGAARSSQSQLHVPDKAQPRKEGTGKERTVQSPPTTAVVDETEPVRYTFLLWLWCSCVTCTQNCRASSCNHHHRPGSPRW